LINLFKESTIPDESKKLISDELLALGISLELFEKYSQVLVNFAENDNSNSSILNDNIILKAQELATSYYETIWDSCTHNEKLLLIDVADNLLINDKNKNLIQTLINKGLLKKDMSIELMNYSLRNLINTKFETDLEKEYLKVRKAGKWTNYRAPILLVIFAIGMFLILQENILSSVVTILPIVATILTAIIKISGILPGFGPSKPTATS